MSQANVPNIGSPGTVPLAATLNTAFSQFASTVDTENLRVDAIHARHIVQAQIQSQAQAARNTTAAATNYVGNTYQAITHGAAALNLSAIAIPIGGTLRVHWHQYVPKVVHLTPTFLNQAVFRLQWDIGAGAAVPPNATPWFVTPSTEVSGLVCDQAVNHNFMGSYIYTNTTGAVVAVTNLWLEINPSLTGAVTDNVDLAEGTIFCVVQNR